MTLALASSAQAAAPLPTQTSFSAVTQTTASLSGAVDPNATEVKDAHFDYITRAAYEADGNAFGEGTLSTPAVKIPTTVKGSGDLSNGSKEVTAFSATSGTFHPGQSITAPGLPAGTLIEFVDKDTLTLSKAALNDESLAALTARGGEARGSGDLEEGSFLVEGLTTTTGAFVKGQTILGQGISPGTEITLAKPDQLHIGPSANQTATNVPLTAGIGQPLSAEITGLAPATEYLFRIVAINVKAADPGKSASGPTLAFRTLAPPLTFPACPNETFRSGALSPFGSPGAQLPDCRSYEQASPLAKNGNHALGTPAYTHAAADGSGITFGATNGLPGGTGAQAYPFYLGQRGQGSWITSGLLPPAPLGPAAIQMIGWLPDFQATYAEAELLGDPNTVALFELHPDGAPPTQIAPYIHSPQFDYIFAGASADANTLAIQAPLALPAEEGGPPTPEAPNVYAWDRQSGQLHIASVFNNGTALPKGAYAGPYDWIHKPAFKGINYYLREERAVSSDGSVFFTSLSDDQLYQRLNPTEPQSALDSEGHCTELSKACTIHISATQKNNGGPAHNGPDPAGPQPAAFMAASADGRTAYFTSPEKLTNDANTGPEQPPAQIGMATLDPEGNVSDLNEGFLPTHALGVAVDPKGEYIYWVDPSRGSIGRAKLNPDGSHGPAENDFIVPGETKAITFPASEPGVYHFGPSRPRHIAVGPCAGGGECVYWTNAGPPLGESTNSDVVGGAAESGGTIGRAKLMSDNSGIEGLPEPDFIIGATDPQGVAVNSAYIYWGNRGFPHPDPERPGDSSPRATIGRATTDGAQVEQVYSETRGNGTPPPTALALGSGRVYYALREGGNGAVYGSIAHIPAIGAAQDGGDAVYDAFANSQVSGLTLRAGVLYWTAKDGFVGRLDLSSPGDPPDHEFLELDGSPFGIASDASHLYFSVNGEAPTNPGNDLYRYQAGASESLKDLTPDPTGNGAEVLGVIGTSDDGAYLYFVANGDLDGAGPAKPGDCVSGTTLIGGSGHCNLYLFHDGETRFLARLSPFSAEGSESLAWAPTREIDPQAQTVLQKTGLVSPDGKTLLFRSRQRLTDYDTVNNELYRYRADTNTFNCISCNPTGEAPGAVPSLGSAQLPQEPRETGIGAASLRYLTANGDRAFFETPEALVSADTNGQDGCPKIGTSQQEFPRCLDVYEWEAPETGSCTVNGPGYSPLNQGCLYLISTGKSKDPALFADASESGNDVFFFTPDQLVGQDTDELFDVYDARVDGGLASQNPSPQPPCEAEGCKGPNTEPPQFTAPPQVSGPPNPKPKRCKKPKGCKKHKKGKKRSRARARTGASHAGA